MRAPWVASTPKMYEPQENVQICVLPHTGMIPFGETSYVTLLSASSDSGFVSEPLASAGEGAVAAQAQSEPTKATKTTRFTRQPYHHGSSSRRIPVRRRRGHLLERGPAAGTHACKPGPSRTRCRRSVCRFLVDGALKRVLVGEAFHPSEKSSIAGSQLRETASCAGFLAQSRGKPGYLAASGMLDLRVGKFLSDRERFARGRDTPASLAERFPILSRKKLP